MGIALIAVVSTAQFQIWQGSKQKQHGLSAIQAKKKMNKKPLNIRYTYIYAHAYAHTHTQSSTASPLFRQKK